MKQEHAYCRTLTGHRWGDPTIDQFGGKYAPFMVTEQCDQCGCKRVATFNVHGAMLIKWKYTYPDKYLVKGGVNKDAIRSELLTGRRKQVEE